MLLESILLPNPASDKARTYINIPISQKLINIVNEIKRLSKLPAFNICLECDVIHYELGSNPRRHPFSAYVSKPIYGREENLVIFTSDEIDLLMKELKYVKILRVEIPLPLKVEQIARRSSLQLLRRSWLLKSY